MKENKSVDQKVVIRNEKESDYITVEKITREAFYNLYVPGCFEHYLIHIMRQHEDFIKELDFIIEVDGQIIGNIMYTKAKLVAESGEVKVILTFGPLSIKPEFQRFGYGKLLMEHSFKEAAKMGYDTVVIFGNPGNYVSSGFKSSKLFDVSLEGKIFPAAMMVRELKEGVLKNKAWVYYHSPVMDIDTIKAQAFDDSLEKMEKKYLPSQEEFYIISNSFMQ